jgi:hypothetical protein
MRNIHKNPLILTIMALIASVALHSCAGNATPAEPGARGARTGTTILNSVAETQETLEKMVDVGTLKPDQVRPIMEVTKKIHDESENLETALRAYNAAMTVAQANEAMGKVQGSLALINTLLAEAYKADIEGEAAQQVLALLGNISMAIGETAKTVAQLQGGQ